MKKKKGTLFSVFMDFEKTFNRVDMKTLWEVLGIYGAGGRLLLAVK